MKTLTKVLSMLMVIVMCMGFFGAAAYADDCEHDWADGVCTLCGIEQPAEEPSAPAAAPSAPVAEPEAPEAAPGAEVNAAGLNGTEFEGVGNVEDEFEPTTLEPPTATALEFKMNSKNYELNSGDSIKMYVFGNAGEIDPRVDVFYAEDADGNLFKLAYSVNDNCVTFSSSSLDKLSANADGSAKSYTIKYKSGLGIQTAGTCSISVSERADRSSFTTNIKIVPRYSNVWSAGDGKLWFTVDPSPVNCKISVDGKPLGTMDYDCTMGGGYFYLGVDYLNSLSRGWHTITVYSPALNESATCEFKVAAGAVTLAPKSSSKHVTGSGLSLTFVCSEPIEKVFVGNKELGNYDSYDYYYLSGDGKTITLSAAFMNNKLTAGSTYYLNVETDEGPASCTFQILTTAQASSSPQTGDTSNISLWAAMLIITGVGAAVAVPTLTKKKVSE